ncbi:MAG TPA: M56 family metallopeptidase [Acidobacteriaceae bacterium]|jgi:Zn-dependent protease with chaperone function
MLPLFHTVQSFAPAASGALVASVWEGLLLASAVAVGLRLFPRLSAAARSVIWVAVLVTVLMLPLLSLALPQDSIASALHVQGAQSGLPLGIHPGIHLNERWSFALAGLWAVFSLGRLAQLAISALRLRSMAKRAVPVEPEANIAALLQAGDRRAELCVSDEVDRPSVIGFFRPRILLPPELLTQFTAVELEPIVLHEMEHLRRRDDWTNLLQKAGLALLPLNPVLLWLDRRLCLERELACDDGVLRATKARKAYAACLTELAEQSLVRRGVMLALGLFGKQPSELARRVYRILQQPSAGMGRAQARAATCALLAGVGCGAVMLARSPQLVSFSTPTANDVTQARLALPAPIPAPRSSLIAQTWPEPVHAAPVTPNVCRRATLVKASMPRSVSRGNAHNALRVCARTRRNIAALSQVAQLETPETLPWMVLAEWRSEALPARMAPTAVPVAQVFRAVQVRQVQFGDSQLTYAAVPTRDGWLIVQL